MLLSSGWTPGEFFLNVHKKFVVDSREVQKSIFNTQNRFECPSKKKKTIDHEWVEKIGLSTKIVQEVQNVGQPF